MIKKMPAVLAGLLALATPLLLAAEPQPTNAAASAQITPDDDDDFPTLEEINEWAKKRDADPSLRFQSDCAAGKASACTKYGYALLKGLYDLPVNKVESAEYFGFGCDMGSMLGCRGLGMVKADRSDPSIAPDLPAARAAFTKACDGNDGASCFYLARMVGRGEGGEKNGRAQIDLITKSCSLGFATACEVIQRTKAKRAAEATSQNEGDRP